MAACAQVLRNLKLVEKSSDLTDPAKRLRFRASANFLGAEANLARVPLPFRRARNDEGSSQATMGSSAIRATRSLCKFGGTPTAQ
jgi:hypothetical protein